MTLKLIPQRIIPSLTKFKAVKPPFWDPGKCPLNRCVYGTVRWQIPKPSTNKGTTVITGKLVVGWKSMQIHLPLWHKYFSKMYRVIN